MMISPIVAEIAEEMDIPVGTVKWHLFEAKKELKRGMDTMRKTSELKFNPINFTSVGINGSIGTKSCDEFLLSLGFERNKDGTYKVVKPNSSRVALFAHEGFGMFFLSNLLNIPYPLFCSRFGLNHSGMTVIHFDEKKEITTPYLLTLSNDSHLYKEGLSTEYNNKFLFLLV